MLSRAQPGLLLALILLSCACDQGSRTPPSEAVSRGRVTWSARCAVCHNADPSKAGPIGPAVLGASRELLEARVLSAGYPAGYKPKRTTTLMQPMPDLAGSLDDLSAFLVASPTP